MNKMYNNIIQLCNVGGGCAYLMNDEGAIGDIVLVFGTFFPKFD